ncbi:DUF2304 domain-containing protein [[Clostridium] innocuum]|nr:DUF2304 domain-containing protein [[Clostridium] innocuum]
MNSILRIYLIIVAILFLLFILKNLKQKMIEIRYAIAWLSVAIVIFFISIFPETVTFITRIFNIRTPINTIMIVAIFILFIAVFSLTLVISSQRKSIIKITQELSITLNEIEYLKEENKIND